jgi:uncharacterized membrane protein YheB (UPF0754 family)
MSIWLVSIPFISAFIGWFTNWLAIKMIFHPKRPIKILWINIQGILPKHRQQLAEKAGKLVSTEFLSFNDIEQKISSPESLQKILPVVDQHIDEFLRVKLGKSFPMISMFIGEKTIGSLKAAFMAELEELFPILMQQYAAQLKKDIDLEQIVTGKLKEFSTEKLETVLHRAMSKELRLAGLFGAVLGFVIGLMQLFIIILASS